MAEAIGSALTGLTQFNVNTKMPSLSDNADIQEALRLYHYGAPSGTGVGQYDPTSTNPANLVNPSIAHSLYNLQTQITNVSGSLGVQASTWTAKGALVTATAASTVTALTIPTPATSYEGYVLTMNSGAATGLSWASPPVTATNTITLTNKTLTAPKITASSFIADTNGNAVLALPALVTSPVNFITISNAATTAKPTISATGSDTNITLNLVSKGTGFVQVNGVDIDTISGTQTLTNKTLTSPTINSPTVTQLYLSDSVVVFEGSVADAFETTLGVVNPTAARTINLPDVSGTVITTGNLSSITTVGTVTSGSFPAANLTGTALPAAIVSSSLTSVGTVTSGSFPAANLSGTTLASNVISSSLTSFGTSPTIATPTLTLSTSSSTTDARISWDTTNKKIQVGDGTSATDFASSTLRVSTPTFTTNAYTAALTDKDKWLELSNGATAGTFYINTDAAVNFPVGTQINLLQTGTGQITIAATTPGTTTVNATPGFKLRAQWSSATLIKRAANLWVVVGDLTA